MITLSAIETWTQEWGILDDWQKPDLAISRVNKCNVALKAVTDS